MGAHRVRPSAAPTSSCGDGKTAERSFVPGAERRPGSRALRRRRFKGGFRRLGKRLFILGLVTLVSAGALVVSRREVGDRLRTMAGFVGRTEIERYLEDDIV